MLVNIFIAIIGVLFLITLISCCKHLSRRRRNKCVSPEQSSAEQSPLEGFDAPDNCGIKFDPPGPCVNGKRTLTGTQLPNTGCAPLPYVVDCDPKKSCEYRVEPAVVPGFCDTKKKTAKVSRFITGDLNSRDSSCPNVAWFDQKCNPDNDCQVTFRDNPPQACDPVTNTRTRTIGKITQRRNIGYTSVTNGGCDNVGAKKVEYCDPNNDCKIEWLPPDTPCDPKTKTRVIKGKVIQKQGDNGGCTTTKTETCDPANDCVVSWLGLCDQKTKKRTMKGVITNPQKPGGLACPTSLIKPEEKCDPLNDCVMSEVRWSQCDTKTNTQTSSQFRTRAPNKAGGCACDGEKCEIKKEWPCDNIVRTNESITDWLKRNPQYRLYSIDEQTGVYNFFKKPTIINIPSIGLNIKSY